MMLETLREDVTRLHAELPRWELINWTTGNVSGRDPETNLVVIKPSGVRYRDLRPEHMVVLDLEGNIVEGDYKYSSDTASHLYIYRHRPDVHGVVHTHSRYATAFSAHGRAIPCVLTSIAGEFGGAVPCGGLAMIGREDIGQEVVQTLEGTGSPAALLQNHGVFTVGPTVEKAVRAAAMTEDAARTVWIAERMGEPEPLAPDRIEALQAHEAHAPETSPPPETAPDFLLSLRQEAAALHAELPRWKLVTWTAGSLSVRDPDTGLVVIKPHGVHYHDLNADSMVVVDLEGSVIWGQFPPSSELLSHLQVYRAREDVFGVAHTHSPYATGFAALGREIPGILTALADEFGGPVPCAGFGMVGSEAVGALALEAMADYASPAALLKQHGVLTVGPNLEAAVKAAVMAEDAAYTVWLALLMGQPKTIPEEMVQALRHRYVTDYGQ